MQVSCAPHCVGNHGSALICQKLPFSFWHFATSGEFSSKSITCADNRAILSINRQMPGIEIADHDFCNAVADQVKGSSQTAEWHQRIWRMPQPCSATLLFA